MAINVALKEKEHGDALSKKEVQALLGVITERHVIPVEIEADNSSAMGFVGLAAAEKASFDLRRLEDFLREIMNDMEKESENCVSFTETVNEQCRIYRLDDFMIWMAR